jgi:2-keto-3-deoxy-L-rhamnonate aldolase RhmA
MCRFIQIEHKDAIENLEEIMKNPYIDGYIFGANDLSGSYNMLGNVFSEKITTLIKETTERLHNAGKYVGLSTGDLSEKTFRHWRDMGVDMLSAGADFDFLTVGMRKNKESLSEIMKGL